jgi:hypothetical protein
MSAKSKCKKIFFKKDNSPDDDDPLDPQAYNTYMMVK